MGTDIGKDPFHKSPHLGGNVKTNIKLNEFNLIHKINTKAFLYFFYVANGMRNKCLCLGYLIKGARGQYDFSEGLNV